MQEVQILHASSIEPNKIIYKEAQSLASLPEVPWLATYLFLGYSDLQILKEIYFCSSDYKVITGSMKIDCESNFQAINGYKTLKQTNQSNEK